MSKDLRGGVRIELRNGRATPAGKGALVSKADASFHIFLS